MDPEKSHLVEKLDRDALPLLAEEEEGLGREDKVLQRDALLRLLHCHNAPATPDCDRYAIGEVKTKNEQFLVLLILKRSSEEQTSLLSACDLVFICI